MKTLIFILIVFVLSTNISFAKTKVNPSKTSQKVTKTALKKVQKDQLGTSFSFEAASVRGKYQMAGQGIAMVEDEKVLDDLLGLRRSFKDREQQEGSRR